MKQPILSFNGGEVTPLLEGRLDLQTIARSCRKLRNFMPLATGAAVRRPSLLHVAEAPDSSHEGRLIPFVYDTSTIYNIHITRDYINVLDLTGAILWSVNIDRTWSTSGASAWSAANFPIHRITWHQVNDVLFLACDAFPPLVLKRYSDSSWEDFSICSRSGFGKHFWPPVLDESVSDLADPSDVVENWTIAGAHNAVAQNTIIGGIPDSSVTGVENGPCPGYWKLYSGTTAWNGTVQIQVSDSPSGTWRTIQTITASYGAGAMTERKAWFHHAKYMRVYVSARTSGTFTFEVRHIGSVAAPSVWASYDSGTGAHKLYSSPDAFTDISPGDQIQLTHKRLTQQVYVTVAASATDEFKQSAELYVAGTWEMFTTGSWQGEVYVEVKESTGSWRVLKQVRSNSDYNHSISGTSDGEFMRVRVEKYNAAATSSAAVPRFTLSAIDSLSQIFVTVDTKTSAHELKVFIDANDKPQAAEATTAISMGAFNAIEGYPAAVCVHEQRVFFGGTTKRPTTIWGSTVNDLFNFQRTSLEDSGFMFDLASYEGNPIQWLVSASRGVLAGTAGDEWLVDGADTGLTGTNINARRQSRVGSHPVQAMPVAGNMVFVQRGALALQEYQFAWESQQFQAVNLTELIKHLTPEGIKGMAFSQNPEPVLWLVMEDGSFLSCAYNRQQEVIAWSRHTTPNGLVESISVTYGQTGNVDDIWFLVNRGGTRYLEKLDPDFWPNLYDGGRLYHLDRATVYSGTSTTSITGLAHLNGLTVSRIANGVQIADAVVSGGAVAVPSGTTHAVIGLSYADDSIVQPMPFDVNFDTGTAQSRKYHTPQVAFRLYRSDAGTYSDKEAGTFFDITIPNADYTGIIRSACVGDMNDAFTVAIKPTGGLPLNLLAVVPSVNVYGE